MPRSAVYIFIDNQAHLDCNTTGYRQPVELVFRDRSDVVILSQARDDANGGTKHTPETIDRVLFGRP